MSEYKTFSGKESMEMAENDVEDFPIVYGFDVKDGKIVPPKIKFDKCVYERLEAFKNEDAADAGWSLYGVFKLIMGECDKEDYDMNPFGNAEMFEPSKDFEHWLDMHSEWGPILIMQALLYGDYELAGDGNGSN